MNLFTTEIQTSNTTGAESGMGTFKGGIMTAFIWGTFGGGTVTIEISHDDGLTWFDYGIAATDKFMGEVKVASRLNGLKIRAQLTGATSPSLKCVVL